MVSFFLFLYLAMAERGRLCVSFSFYKATNPSMETPSSSKPNYLPKPYLLISSHWEVRVSAFVFLGAHTSFIDALSTGLIFLFNSSTLGDWEVQCKGKGLPLVYICFSTTLHIFDYSSHQALIAEEFSSVASF
jgi:hypothetical protein